MGWLLGAFLSTLVTVFTGGTAALITGTVAGHFLVTAALGYALNSLSPKPGYSGRRGYNANTVGSDEKHAIIYGRAKVGGVIIYNESTNNDLYLHRVIVFAGHEIDEYETVYLNDEALTLDSSGNVTAPSKYAGLVRVKLHYGTDTQSADSDLVAESNGLWTTAHQVLGRAYIYIRFKFDENAFPNGVPTVTALIRGKKVYDPRTGVTMWSDNPALCIRDYLTSDYGLNTDDVDDSMVITAANVCDEDVTLATGGTEKRYTCNGSFLVDKPAFVLPNLLTSMGGMIWFSQGKWRMKAATYTSPVASFTESDLRGDLSISTRHSQRDNFNAVKGTFSGAETNWQITDYPEVSSSVFLTEDNNIKSVMNIDLPFTSTSSMAQRIAKIALYRQRQQITVTGKFGLRALELTVGDVIQLSDTNLGWTDKEFEVTNWRLHLTNDLDIQIELVLREISSAVFDWAAEESQFLTDNTNLPDPFNVPVPTGLTATTSVTTNADGTVVSVITVQWNSVASNFVNSYEIQWKPSSDSNYTSIVTTSTNYVTPTLVSGETYDFRVRAINTAGVKSDWATLSQAAVQDTTAPAKPTGLTAVVRNKEVVLKWDNPVDVDYSHTEIYQNTSNDSATATKVADVKGTVATVSGLTNGTTYWFWTKAVDTSGNVSGFSTNVSGTPAPLDNTDIGDGAIYPNNFASTIKPVEIVSSLPAAGTQGRTVFLTTDNKLYRDTGTSWTTVVDNADIASGAVTADKLAANSVVAGKIAAGAVGANEISVTELSAITATVGLLRTSTTGERLEIASDVIRVYDASDVLRVKLGNLA